MNSSIVPTSPECLIGHRPWLNSVVRSRIPEQDAVDDIVSEILVDAIEHVRQGKKVEQIAPWLYRIAIRKVLLFRRTKGRTRRTIESYAHRDGVSEPWYESSPLETLLQNERRGFIERAMCQLRGRDAEIITFKYVHGWNYQQIADQLGISRVKVTHRLRMARRNLRNALRRLGVTENDR